MSVYGEILMFFYLFNWKVKLGVILTVGLFLGAVITFVVAWEHQCQKMSFLTRVILYHIVGFYFSLLVVCQLDLQQ